MNAGQIRKLRKALNVSQQEFLLSLGIETAGRDAARQMVSRWERGMREPSGAAEVLLRQLWVKTFSEHL